MENNETVNETIKDMENLLEMARLKGMIDALASNMRVNAAVIEDLTQSLKIKMKEAK